MDSWPGLDEEIADAAVAIAETGKFDDAIFAAFRLIEGEIQRRIGSASIGHLLLDEAFDGPSPRIDISPDARDRIAMKQLFAGALGNIRNDRGHKKVPLTPCKTKRECLLYLQFATLLLELLNKDRNTYPLINSIRVFGTADRPLLELRGKNFDKHSEVSSASTTFQIYRRESDLLEISLPPGFSGEVVVTSIEKVSNAVYCDTDMLSNIRENTYEVLAADIPLFADDKGKITRDNVVGLLLQANEAGTEFRRILPTQSGRYKSGDFVTHGPFAMPSVEQSWYRPPGEIQLEVAWHSSMLALPQVVGRSSQPTIGGVSIKPSPIRTQVGEKRVLRAVAWERNGPSGKEVDISSRATWSVADQSVAFYLGEL